VRSRIGLLAVAVAIAGVSAAAGTPATSPRSALVPNAIAFRDRLDGVMGTGWQGCVNRAWHCRLQGTISVTSDGGRAWRVVLRTPRPVVSVVRQGNVYYARIDDGETLRSTDGGRRWSTTVAPRPLISPCPAGMQSYISGSWALCTGQGAAGNSAKSVYRFTSAGPRRVAYTPMTGRGRGGISSFGYPAGISGNEQGFGVIWEDRGTLYVTRDGGHHWLGLTKLAPPDVVFGDSAYVLFRGLGFALLSTGGSEKRWLLETSDAGRTWRVVHRWR